MKNQPKWLKIALVAVVIALVTGFGFTARYVMKTFMAEQIVKQSDAAYSESLMSWHPNTRSFLPDWDTLPTVRSFTHTSGGEKKQTIISASYPDEESYKIAKSGLEESTNFEAEKIILDGERGYDGVIELETEFTVGSFSFRVQQNDSFYSANTVDWCMLGFSDEKREVVWLVYNLPEKESMKPLVEIVAQNFEYSW